MIRARAVVATATTGLLLAAWGATSAAAEQTESRTEPSATGGVRYEKQVVDIPGGDGLEVTEAAASPKCDKGWRAVSGGQAVKPSPSRAIGDSSIGGRRYFYAAGWQRHQKASPFAAYSVCLETTGLTMETSSEFGIPADSQVTDAAYCVEGNAVGGGMRPSGDVHAFSLNASYPVDSGADADTLPDDGWRAYAQYSGEGAGSGDGALFDATCLTGPRPAYRSVTVNVPATTSVSAQALCPKRRPVIGGGVYVNGSADKSHVHTSRPWDGQDSGTVPEDGWRGGVVNTSGSALQMTVHAICR